VCGKESNTKEILLRIRIKIQELLATRRYLQDKNSMKYRKMVNQDRFTIKTPIKKSFWRKEIENTRLTVVNSDVKKWSTYQI